MRIRALEPEDLDVLYSIENDMSLWWVGARTAPLSRYHLRDYVANCESDIYKDEQVRFVIEGEAGDVVGLIDLFNFSPQHNRAELGVVVTEQARGRGIAQKAIEQVTVYARDIVGLHQIYAIVPVTNSASIAMLERQHFKTGLCLKDWLKVADKYEDAYIMQLFL